MDNVKITKIGTIPPGGGDSKSYQYDLINFGDIEMICMKKASSLTMSELKPLINGKTHLIVVEPISQDDIDSNIVSVADAESLVSKPSVVFSSSKSLMPQLIVPMGNVLICDNGLRMNKSTAGLESIKANDGKTGWEWIPDTVDVSGTPLTDTKFWGVRETQTVDSGSISMAGVKSPPMDDIITKNRRYILNTEDFNANYTNYFGPGACVIGYQFLGGEESGVGNGTDAKKAPHLLISLTSKKESSTSKEIKVSVNPKQGIYARVGEDIGQGSLTKPQITMLPPNCKNYEEQWNCMFLYPLYEGFAISSQGTKALNSKEDGTIFIQYGSVKPALNNVDYCGASSYITNEMNSYMSAHPESAIEWFPAIVHSSGASDAIGIGVKKGDDRVELDDDPYIEWEKSYGKFFYAPIFFHKRMKFSLYFFGEPQTETTGGSAGVNDSGTYYFYPVVTTETTDGEEADYDTGITKKTGKVSGKRINYGKRITAKKVGSFSETNETIYRADFNFKASKPQRFPLEVWGAVSVFKKTNFKFGLTNSNSREGVDFPTLFTANTALPGMSNFPVKDPTDFAIGLNISASRAGVNGTLDLDEYAMSDTMTQIKLPQIMSEFCISAGLGTSSSNVFTGYALESKKSGSENNNTISIGLAGVQKKLEDLKLIAAPFWDGDRLETICCYFEKYCNVKIKMVDYTISNITAAKDTTEALTSGTWKSDSKSVVVNSSVSHEDFRVPRSTNYRKPAVDFKTGTRCIDALNKLATLTGCDFVVQPDGICYFFELNKMGIPYYIAKQKENIVAFSPADIISINVSPYLDNKYNTFATMGFIQKINKKGELVMASVAPQVIYTPYQSLTTNFPWARVNTYVENGYMTLSELSEVHTNNVKFGVSDIYQGTVTVKGNTSVNHIYQKVKICGTEFFVVSIDHRIDLQTKNWTTSYGLSLYSSATTK